MRKHLIDVKVVIDIAGRGYGDFNGILDGAPNVDLDAHNYQVSFVTEEATVCPRSSDPFRKVSCHIDWLTTSWTYSNVDFIFE